MLKYYIKFYSNNFKSASFYLPSAFESRETWIQFDLINLNNLKKRYFHWIIFKQMEIMSKMKNFTFGENYYIKPYIF